MQPDSHSISAAHELKGASRANVARAVPSNPLDMTSGVRGMLEEPPLRAVSTLRSCLAGSGVTCPLEPLHRFQAVAPLNRAGIPH